LRRQQNGAGGIGSDLQVDQRVISERERRYEVPPQAMACSQRLNGSVCDPAVSMCQPQRHAEGWATMRDDARI